MAPVTYHELPAHARGRWAAPAPIDTESLLLVLIPSGPGTDERRLDGELARADLKTGTTTTLVRLPAGKTVYAPIVAGRTVAWVETSAASIDLRAYGWRLHVTDIITGADRVVAEDPGIHPPDVQTVIPALAFDGSTLLYSVLAERDAVPRWELIRYAGDRKEKIAELSDPASQRILRIRFDDRHVVWHEQATRPQLRDTIVMYDIAAASTIRREGALGLEQISDFELGPGRIYFATTRGVFETDRSMSGDPVLASGAARATQVAIVAHYLLYLDYDSETLAAVDLRSRARAVVATGVTAGPRVANGVVSWYARPGPSGGGYGLSKPR